MSQYSFYWSTVLVAVLLARANTTDDDNPVLVQYEEKVGIYILNLLFLNIQAIKKTAEQYPIKIINAKESDAYILSTEIFTTPVNKLAYSTVTVVIAQSVHSSNQSNQIQKRGEKCTITYSEKDDETIFINRFENDWGGWFTRGWYRRGPSMQYQISA